MFDGGERRHGNVSGRKSRIRTILGAVLHERKGDGPPSAKNGKQYRPTKEENRRRSASVSALLVNGKLCLDPDAAGRKQKRESGYQRSPKWREKRRRRGVDNLSGDRRRRRKSRGHYVAEQVGRQERGRRRDYRFLGENKRPVRGGEGIDGLRPGFQGIVRYSRR